MNLIPLIVTVSATAIVLLALLFLIIEVWVVIIGHIKGAPFIRSRREKIAVMFDLAKIQPGERVVDLGSGDGTLLIEAARRGAHATGIEINPFLVWYSNRRMKRAGLKNAEVLWRDFRKYPLRDADVVFLYLWPSTIEKLREKLSRELKRGARVISNSFPIKGWQPVTEKDRVYLYKKS